jgi:peptide/nickel transport system permease protein
LSLLPEWATQAEVEAYRHQLGLDLPLYQQYLHWLVNILHGDFGSSYATSLPALPFVLQHFPPTIKLALTALIISIVVSFPLGILAATHRGSLWDRACMALALVGQAMPHFWLGLMLILVVGVKFRLLPVSGDNGWTSLILPAITLATAPIAQLARLVRSGMLEVLNQDYVRTARAKGLRNRAVLTRHALRNAMLPLITVIALEIGSLLNGSVVIEVVFAWPGIGHVLVDALEARDIPIVEAGVLVIAWIYIIVNLVADILYARIDPRVRYT